MNEATEPLVDQAARHRIDTDTASTLFVTAGAGSGKTTALVTRVATLVLRDGVPLSRIAAMTFTEKAGAELRDRLREHFEKRWRTPRDATERSRAEAALDDLDSAAIGTLHSFAQRILTMFPIEARVPPMLDVLDEVGSSVAFEERWSELQRALLDDDEVAQPLLLAMAADMSLKHVRSLAVQLGKDWDFLESRVLVGDPEPVVMPELTAFAAQARAVADRVRHCTDEDDRLLPSVRRLGTLVDQLDTAPDAETRLRLLQEISAVRFGRIGAKGNWTCTIQDVRDEGAAVTEEARRLVAQVADQCLRRVTRWVAEQVLAAAEARRAAGRLEFHDLLVLARELLRDHAHVRQSLHDQFERLLLDEFQDTDPIQIELAVRIAAGAAGDQADWRDVPVPAGRLFVVGDAKQSIYRFRRADIRTYFAAQDALGDTETLRTNFRSVAPVVDWVNAVFGQLIVEEPGKQPPFEPLAADRTETGDGPAVTVLGAEPHEGGPKAAELRTAEAADVAAVVRRAVDERWQVWDERDSRWREAEPRDVAILVPSRISLPFLEDALDAANLPYHAEASSLVYQAAEVRDLLVCARAIADTTDELALVAALRSPAFGCGDDDLWRWRQGGGRFNLRSRWEAHPLAEGPVGAAFAYLTRLSFEARWLAPSEVLGRIIADRRMLEVAATGPRSRDAWRRLRFVVDQARAWSEVSHGGLRAYLAWAAHQGQEASRVAEAVLPETDQNAVRIMTVHAAKGLEFPIVVLSGMSTQPRRPSGVRLLWPPAGGYAVQLRAGLATADFEEAVPIDEQMDDRERLRLLYVATTRARDHLVVSLHRARTTNPRTGAELLASAGAATVEGTVAFEPGSTRVPPSAPVPVEPPPAYDAWQAGVLAARTASRVPAAQSASGLEGTDAALVLTAPAPDAAEEAGEEAGAAKGPRNLELPPWTKGRYGSAVGRAVHAVLQSVDLATGDGVDAASAAQALAEGVSDQADLVAALSRSALAADVVRRAAARDHWREIYVGTVQQDGTVLEGYVDLVYREDDGSLVVVDYKTDAVPAGGIASRVAYYRPQMQAYVDCLRDATGSPVTATLLFLHPDTAVPAPV